MVWRVYIPKREGDLLCFSEKKLLKWTILSIFFDFNY